jgi:hypothetical protein
MLTSSWPIHNCLLAFQDKTQQNTKLWPVEIIRCGIISLRLIARQYYQTIIPGNRKQPVRSFIVSNCAACFTWNTSTCPPCLTMASAPVQSVDSSFSHCYLPPPPRTGGCDSVNQLFIVYRHAGWWMESKVHIEYGWPLFGVYDHSHWSTPTLTAERSLSCDWVYMFRTKMFYIKCWSLYSPVN